MKHLSHRAGNPRRSLQLSQAAQQALRLRVVALPPDAQLALTVVAARGVPAEFDLLAAVTGLPEPRLIAALKSLIIAGFLIEPQPDSFALRDPRAAKAITGDLLARERRALHAAIARAIETQAGDRSELRAADLARHYDEAGAWEPAHRYARIAGEQALARDAPRVALGHFTRGLAAAERVEGTAAEELRLARAAVYERLGDFELAEADLTAAQQAAEREGRTRAAWQALLRLGYLWAARDYRRSLRWFEQALALADALADPPTRAETLNRIGNVYLNEDRPDAALPYHEQARAAFEAAGDQAGLANTLELMAVCYYNLPDVLAGAACDEEALALARAVGERTVAFHAAIHLLLPLRFDTEVGPRADPVQLIAQTEEALADARRMGWAGGEAQALGLLGGFLALLGQYGRGLALLHEGLALAERLGYAAGISAAERMIAAALLDLLAMDEAAARLRRARQTAIDAGAYLFADIASPALAQTLAERGGRADIIEARQLLDGLLEGERALSGRLRREALTARGELELAEGNAVAALATLTPLIESTARLDERGHAGAPRLALLLGRARLAAGELDAAETALGEAIEGAGALGRVGLLWRSHAALGRVRLRQRRRKAAREQFDRARALITELAATIDDPALADQFARRASATMPLPPPLTPRRVKQAGYGGLTERQRQVARLVQQGRSNREIGKALVISERTAERHVANILDRLGLASRVQLAAWATENLPSLSD